MQNEPEESVLIIKDLQKEFKTHAHTTNWADFESLTLNRCVRRMRDERFCHALGERHLFRVLGHSLST